MEKFKFICNIVIQYQILNIIQPIFKAFQSKDLELMKVTSLLNNAFQSMNKLQTKFKEIKENAT